MPLLIKSWKRKLRFTDLPTPETSFLDPAWYILQESFSLVENDPSHSSQSYVLLFVAEVCLISSV